MRRSLFVFTLFATVFSLSLFDLSTHEAGAADPVESITISPVSKDYRSLKPGDIKRDTITVLNDGQTPYSFTIYATPYSINDESYSPSFSETPPNADAYSWIEFERTTYHIKPRETLHIPYTIRVKNDASPGGHYGAIFAEVQPSDDPGQIVRTKRVGSIIYATVEGDIKQSGKILGLETNWFQSRVPLRSTVRVKNDGNVDFRANVNYQVADVFGRLLFKTDNQYAVLPNSTRKIDVEWNGVAWFGLYKVRTSVEVLGESTSNDQVVLVAPTWLILITLLMIISGGIYAFLRRARSNRN